jgi:hypothetical protein
MSALGQKQTSRWVRVMSALPPKADIAGRQFDVRFVPKADIRMLKCPVWGVPLAAKASASALFDSHMPQKMSISLRRRP